MSSQFISNHAKIGRSVHLDEDCRIYGPAVIGENTFIGDRVIIGYPYSGVGYDKTGIKYFIKKRKENKKLTLDDVVKKETLIGKNSIIESGTRISSGTKIGEGFQCEFDCFIGSDVEIGKKVIASYRTQIYDDVIIGDNCWIAGFVCERCKIERNVTMMGNLVHKYNFSPKKRPALFEGEEEATKIEEYAVIGFGATVVGGVNIGKRAYVAAGAVVTKDVEPDDLIAGNPARSIKNKIKSFK